MFPRLKKSGNRHYVQIVENTREHGKVVQRLIASLGRLDALQESGDLSSLAKGFARMCEGVCLLEAHHSGSLQVHHAQKLGPSLVFEKLWKALGIKHALHTVSATRKHQFSLERAVFLTVLHRLFASGSDRAAERWKADYVIEGVQSIELHQLYRAMAWLGEPLPDEQQQWATAFSPRCVKDLIEEELFNRESDLFANMDLVFFDTTSIYFEGEGGETLGQFGKSKDSRPDRKQIVVAMILNGDGRPICCELWPGNTTDVKTLLPIVSRLRKRFHIHSICVVADRGMIAKRTLESLEAMPQMHYILGVRMRKTKEVREKVLRDNHPYLLVYPKSSDPKAPAPLEVKEVCIEKRRYIVCHNVDQAAKDAVDRELILKSLQEKIRKGDKQFVGNEGYRRYLKTEGAHFAIDYEKARAEALYDGKWVLRTNTSLDMTEVALKYKQLWMVEDMFRTTKSILDTRPIYHKCDETIRGHVFCSFLALLLRYELQRRLEQKNWRLEWGDTLRDLERIQELTLTIDEQSYRLRTETVGNAGKVFQACGIALPPIMQKE